MRIYSSAYVDKETGDLNGYDLAIDAHTDSTADAWLYVYEGASNEDGIHISGRIISGKRLTLSGTWAEHLIEYPSKKEIVNAHFVRLDGNIDPTWFRGKLTIEGLSAPEKVRLKHTIHIWACKTKAEHHSHDSKLSD